MKFLNGNKIVLTFKDAWKVPRDRNYRYKYDDEAIEGNLQSITYMLDHLHDLDIKELGGICHLTDIILMGHSLGGNVADILGFKDNRIKAVVDIDSKITEREVLGHIGVPSNPSGKPVLFIRGMMQYQENLGDQLSKIQNATIWSPYVQHSAFSDQAYFSAKIQNFGTQIFFSDLLKWFLKQGPHWHNIDTHLGAKDTDTWFTEYPKYIVHWLNSNSTFHQ